MPIRVLIVDDSAVVRQTLQSELAKDSEIDVVGTAADPYIARDKIVTLKPDVITLDIEMPRMDGITFLKKLMVHHPLPIIIVSSLSKSGSDVALEAVRCGAVEVLCKPGAAYTIGDLSAELRQKVKSAYQVDIKKIKQLIDAGQFSEEKKLSPLIKTTNKILVLGASTGGTQAIEKVIKSFPLNAPGTVIVQHMPAGFTRAFSERLNSICQVEVCEAKNGDSITPGKVLIAPGNFHTLVRRSGAQYFVEVKDGPMVGHHRPSVDILFRSAAESAGKNAIAVILTGMGADGASGMEVLKKAGTVNIAQDENSCVVFGMPRAAIEKGCVDHILSLESIAGKVMDLAIK